MERRYYYMKIEIELYDHSQMEIQYSRNLNASRMKAYALLFEF